MMYESKLVASLKANGKILREFKDTVYIPFGSEYSFLIKNLNTKRAVVNVFIDGENVVDGGLVIDPGREVDLERSIKNNNLKAGNKFKFIERTAAIENGPRGVKLEDGLVRIEFQFERFAPQQTYIARTWVPGHYEYEKYIDNTARFGDIWNTKSINSVSGATYDTGGKFRSVDMSKGMASAQAAANNITAYCAQNNIGKPEEFHDGAAVMDMYNDVGITVPGSKSSQQFQTVTVGALEAEKHCMVFKLLGETANNQAVTEPVTVKFKPKCVTCGKQNKANAKFCTECGTALEIFA